MSPGSGLGLTNPLEAAIFITLSAGNYTALMFEAHGATGVSLVEIYNISSSQ